jgi:hypothetical protein
MAPTEVSTDEDRPWERHGRRDARPHRALFLDVMATASVLCSIFSLCLLIPALLGLPLAIASLVLTRQDLNQMRAGLMDPGGKGQTEGARTWAGWGLLLNLIVLLVAALLLLRMACYGSLFGPAWS